MGRAPIHPAVARRPRGTETMTDIFFAIEHSLALLTGATDAEAGLILAVVTIFGFALAFMVMCTIAKVPVTFYVMLVAFLLGLGFCVSVHWLEPWVAILVIVVPAFVWALGRGKGSGD